MSIHRSCVLEIEDCKCDFLLQPILFDEILRKSRSHVMCTSGSHLSILDHIWEGQFSGYEIISQCCIWSEFRKFRFFGDWWVETMSDKIKSQTTIFDLRFGSVLICLFIAPVLQKSRIVSVIFCYSPFCLRKFWENLEVM